MYKELSKENGDAYKDADKLDGDREDVESKLGPPVVVPLLPRHRQQDAGKEAEAVGQCETMGAVQLWQGLKEIADKSRLI